MLFVGIIVMVLGTYANLYAFEEASSQVSVTEKSNILQVKILEKNDDNIFKELNIVQPPTTS